MKLVLTTRQARKLFWILTAIEDPGQNIIDVSHEEDRSIESVRLELFHHAAQLRVLLTTAQEAYEEDRVRITKEDHP